MSKQDYSKSKGRDAENAVVEWLKANGFPAAERRRLSGAFDKGDIAGVHNLTVEVKAEKAITLSGYMTELRNEVDNTGDEYGVAIVKKRGTLEVDQWYAVMPAEWFLALFKAATKDRRADWPVTKREMDARLYPRWGIGDVDE